MNLLIFLHSREQFGAQIVHIPLLKYLRSQYPGARIVAVSKFKAAKALSDTGYIDEVFIGKGFLFYRKIILQEKIDIAYCLQAKSHSASFAMLFSRIEHRIGFYKKFSLLDSYTPYKKGIYRAINFFNLANKNRASYEEICYEIKNDYSSSDKNYIVLIPGAGGKEKRWPLENFIRLANDIKEKFEPVFIVGPDDIAELSELQKHNFKIINSPAIGVLFQVIAKSKLVISADCGPSHIAHIMRKNQIVLYGTTLDEWFDYRSNSIAIESSNGVQNITVNEVKIAIQKILYPPQ